MNRGVQNLHTHISQFRDGKHPLLTAAVEKMVPIPRDADQDYQEWLFRVRHHVTAYCKSFFTGAFDHFADQFKETPNGHLAEALQVFRAEFGIHDLSVDWQMASIGTNGNCRAAM